MNRIVFALALTLGLLLGAPSGAEVYKWVDQNGVTHYGQNPPPDTPSEQITTPSAPAAKTPGSGAPETGTTEASSGTAPGDGEQQTAQPTETVPPEKLAETCAQVRQTLDTLRNRNRVLVKEGDGYAVMPPDAREKKIQELEQWVAENC